MELRTQVHRESLLFIRIDAHHQLILRVIQQLAEFLEAVLLPVVVGVFLLHPLGERVGCYALVHLHAVRLQHIAQDWQGRFRPHGGLLGTHRANALDHVTAFAAGDVDVVGLLQLLHEIRKRARPVSFLAEGGIELQHGGFQQSKLRAHAAAFQGLQGGIRQRHGLGQIQRRRTPVRLLSTLLLLLLRRLPAGLMGGPRLGWRGRFGLIQQGFVADELVTVLLQNRAGESLPAQHEHALIVLFQFVEQGHEVAIVSGDSDFMALLNKLKQYDKRVFVLGGKAFTSTILQKNCHEFISYESLLDEPKPAPPPQSRAAHQPGGQPPQQQQQQRGQQAHRRPAPLDLAQAMPLVERALQALERRSVRPQLGLLKSTMLQLDSAFSEKAYGSGSFTDFVEKLQKANYVHVTGGEGRYMIKRIGAVGPEKSTVRPEAALPVLRDVLETHRMEVDEGVASDALAEWVKQEHPDYDWKQYGFQEFSELLNYAQDKLVVRINADEERSERK